MDGEGQSDRTLRKKQRVRNEHKLCINQLRTLFYMILNNLGFKSRWNIVIHLYPNLDLELPDNLIHKYLRNVTGCGIFCKQ